MLLIDRYFLTRAGSTAVQILLLTILLLTVENLTRLLDLIEHVDSPMLMLVQMMTALVPEYVAIGVFFALYLGIALTVRAMGLRGEWSILQVSGQSPLRRMLMPMALGVVAALLLLSIRLELQPRGERQLDDIGTAAASGKLGVAFDIGGFVDLPGGGTITVDHYDARSQTAHGIFLTRDDLTVTAPLARFSHYRGRQIKLVLSDGLSLQSDQPAVQFERMQIIINRDFTPQSRPSRATSDQLDRLTLSQLWRDIQTERVGAVDRYPAASSLAARVANTLFCLLIPMLALATAEMPPRTSSGFGIGVGMIAIVGFIKGLSWVEGVSGLWPIAATFVYLILWSVLIIALFVVAARQPGLVELSLGRMLERPVAWLRAMF
jgi:lipopolysaccharide export system permease protein